MSRVSLTPVSFGIGIGIGIGFGIGIFIGISIWVSIGIGIGIWGSVGIGIGIGIGIGFGIGIGIGIDIGIGIVIGVGVGISIGIYIGTLYRFFGIALNRYIAISVYWTLDVRSYVKQKNRSRFDYFSSKNAFCREIMPENYFWRWLALSMRINFFNFFPSINKLFLRCNKNGKKNSVQCFWDLFI